MTSEGLGEMFEGDSADMCIGKFTLMSMGGEAEGSRMRRPGSEDPDRAEILYTCISHKYVQSMQSIFSLLFP